MSVESSLLNRHANRYLDPNVKISREELSALLALAGKAPRHLILNHGVLWF
ncbi:hypothetical protein [Gallibacterium anatis]|uniref:hypothetical protein n=1 Tax=Gallibacterium anatis TaxID=750 RepID=UPI000A5D08F0|nr:hypothetical protein [Gallibacterium anatis]